MTLPVAAAATLVALWLADRVHVALPRETVVTVSRVLVVGSVADRPRLGLATDEPYASSSDAKPRRSVFSVITRSSTNCRR